MFALCESSPCPMDSTNRRQIPGGLIFFGWYDGAMAVHWPSPAAGAMRLTVLRLRPDAWLRSDQRARRGYGRVLAITRGWRHAAHGASPATRCVAAFRSTCKKALWPCTGHHPLLAASGLVGNPELGATRGIRRRAVARIWRPDSALISSPA